MDDVNILYIIVVECYLQKYNIHEEMSSLSRLFDQS